MSNPKRVSLTTIESNTEKIKTKRKGSFRINIPIVEEPASKEYSRFNYETLYKSALDVSKIIFKISLITPRNAWSYQPITKRKGDRGTIQPQSNVLQKI